MPLQYGRMVHMKTDGQVVTRREELYVDYETVQEVTVCSETKRVKSANDIIAEFLKLMDGFKEGDLDMPGIQVLRDKNSGTLRVEKTWKIP